MATTVELQPTPNRQQQQQQRFSSAGSSWVQPAVPVEPTSFQCSAIENLCARVWPAPTLFFPLRANDDSLALYTNLAQGLSRLLNRFPFFTGVLKADTHGAFRLEIPEAPRAGTRFYYADLSGDPRFPSFEELQQGGFPYADGNFDGFSAFRPPTFAVEGGFAPLVTQLNRVDGGHILTWALSHQLLDLVMVGEVIRTWAAETREVTLAMMENRAPRPAPAAVAPELTDRSRLSPKATRTQDFTKLAEMAKDLPNWIVVDPTNPIALKDMESIVPPAYIPKALLHKETELRTTISGVWRFPLASLQELQQNATKAAAAQGQSRLSTIDVLTSYIWERFFAAKYTDFSDRDASRPLPTHSSIVYALNVRRRLNPPLPDDYVAACVDLARCTVPLTTIGARSTDKQNFAGLANMAICIREANTTWTEQNYMAMLQLSEAAPISPGVVPRGPIDMLVTDHSRVAGTYTADWGVGLGVPVAYREPYLGRTPPSGEMTVLPRCENGDLEVMLSGERITMERLRADPDMKRRAKMLFLQHDVVAACEKKRNRARL